MLSAMRWENGHKRNRLLSIFPIFLLLIFLLWVVFRLIEINPQLTSAQEKPYTMSVQENALTTSLLLATRSPQETQPPFSYAAGTATETSLARQTPTVLIRMTESPIASLPWRAYVDPIYGHRQLFNLDCEAATAADWAVFFKKPVLETAFLNFIPKAENPDYGFVGDVNDDWGKLPPDGYGVYAGPVAMVLRSLDLSAFAYRGMAFEQVKKEIASGRPVIAWVIGHVGLTQPVRMTLSGETVIVAPFEHSILVIGYEYQKVIVLDGANRYAVSEIDFLNSWKILGNMAVIAQSLPKEALSSVPVEDLTEKLVPIHK
jgi:uncharacterized protein YvpB